MRRDLSLKCLIFGLHLFPLLQLHLPDELFGIDDHFIEGIAYLGKFTACLHLSPNGQVTGAYLLHKLVDLADGFHAVACDQFRNKGDQRPERAGQEDHGQKRPADILLQLILWSQTGQGKAELPGPAGHRHAAGAQAFQLFPPFAGRQRGIQQLLGLAEKHHLRVFIALQDVLQIPGGNVHTDQAQRLLADGIHQQPAHGDYRLFARVQIIFPQGKDQRLTAVGLPKPLIPFRLPGIAGQQPLAAPLFGISGLRMKPEQGNGINIFVFIKHLGIQPGIYRFVVQILLIARLRLTVILRAFSQDGQDGIVKQGFFRDGDHGVH